MKIKPKAKKQILSVSSRPAQVLRIDDDTVTFQVFFDIDPEAAIEERLTTCNFRVVDEKRIDQPKLRLKALEAVTAFQRSSSKKNAAISEISKSIARGIVDISKQIPNDRIAKILAGSPVRQVKRLTSRDETSLESKSISNLDSSKDEVPESQEYLKSLYLDMLHRKSKDPAAEINAATFHAPIISSVRGVRTTSNMSNVDKKLESTRAVLTKKMGSIVKSTFENDDVATLEIPLSVKIRKFQLKNYTVEIDSKRQVLKFKVNFRDVFEKHIIPTQAPLLQLTNVGSYRSMKIKQLDVNSNSVGVYRKSVNGNENETFSKVISLPLLPGKEIQFIDRNSQAEKSIYRVIPFNELSISSGEFSSAVAQGSKSKKKIEPDNLSLLASEISSGVKVSIFNIPTEVIAIRLVRKNLTIHETAFSNPTSIVGGSLRKLEKSTLNVDFFDSPSRVDASYEYKAIMIDSYGDERESQNRAIVHFSGNAEDQEGYSLFPISLRVGDGGSQSVSFQVEAPTNQSSLDLIYNTLIDAGLDSLYADEIKSNKELFSKIVSLEMLRFDTFTGLNESFGVVSAGPFQDDSKSQRAANVSPLVGGRKYIYQFRLLVRAPGTIFSESRVSKTDLETGKSYSASMKKFSSPNVLKRGILSSTSSQLKIFPRSNLKIDPTIGSAGEMFQGRTSLTGEVVVTMPHIDTEIVELSVEEVVRGNIVKLKINEGLQKIDHIIIYAEYNGKMAPLRALHFFGNDYVVYLDDRLKAALTEVGYYVQLVFQNFAQGQLIGPIKEISGAT